MGTAFARVAEPFSSTRIEPSGCRADRRTLYAKITDPALGTDRSILVEIDLDEKDALRRIRVRDALTAAEEAGLRRDRPPISRGAIDTVSLSPWRRRSGPMETKFGIVLACAAFLAVGCDDDDRNPTPPRIDQQQAAVDGSAGALVVGGPSAQKLAQTVTAGLSGFLRRVEAPVHVQSGELILEIQSAAGGRPTGSVLLRHTVAGSELPPPNADGFRAFELPGALHLAAGTSFAIVFMSTGNGALLQGPVGDPYGAGAAHYDALPNAPGWLPLTGGRGDLPFRTIVQP